MDRRGVENAKEVEENIKEDANKRAYGGIPRPSYGKRAVYP